MPKHEGSITQKYKEFVRDHPTMSAAEVRKELAKRGVVTRSRSIFAKARKQAGLPPLNARQRNLSEGMMASAFGSNEHLDNEQLQPRAKADRPLTKATMIAAAIAALGPNCSKHDVADWIKEKYGKDDILHVHESEFYKQRRLAGYQHTRRVPGLGTIVTAPTAEDMNDCIELRKLLYRWNWKLDRLERAVDILKRFQV